MSSGFRKWSEFKDAKNAGLDGKAKVALMADYTGKTPEKPPENGKYPEQPANTGSVLPYANKGNDVGLVQAEPDGATPLGMAKHPNMEPKKAAPLGEAPPARPSVYKSSRKQLKEFVEETAHLSDTQFVQYLMERKSNNRPPVAMVHDLNGDPFTPHPHEAISYICSLMHNPQMISRLVREAKRNGHLESLVTELMDHPEFYDEAVKMMGDKDEGRRVTDKFARTMSDQHNNFKKEAGLSEARQRFRSLLTEKVAPSLIDQSMSPEDAGIPTPDDGSEGKPMMEPEEMDRAGMNPSAGDVGQMDADGEEVGSDIDAENPGMGDAGIPGAFAPHNMVRSIKGAFPDHFPKFCADGSC